MVRSISTTAWALSWSVCSQGVSRRASPMTTSVGLSIARHASPPRYAENASTIGARQTDCLKRRTAVMALLRMSIVLRDICKRQPMLMAGKSTASQARWVTSLTTPNASCASTSKGEDRAVGRVAFQVRQGWTTHREVQRLGQMVGQQA